MISLSKLSQSFEPGIKVLNEIDLDVREGEFVFILGDSGTGKTTLLKILSSELLPSEGYIGLMGHDLSSVRLNKLLDIRKKIGVIYQDLKLLPSMTVFENVAITAHINGLSGKSLKREADTALEIVGLANKKDYYIHNLSGGEKQRIAIARVIARRPKLIIADEPTGSLDPNMSWTIMETLLKLNNQGATVVVATHAKDIVRKLSKKTYTLKQGKLLGGERCIL